MHCIANGCEGRPHTVYLHRHLSLYMCSVHTKHGESGEMLVFSIELCKFDLDDECRAFYRFYLHSLKSHSTWDELKIEQNLSDAPFWCNWKKIFERKKGGGNRKKKIFKQFKKKKKKNIFLGGDNVFTNRSVETLIARFFDAIY